jgi:hypothetical protein
MISPALTLFRRQIFDRKGAATRIIRKRGPAPNYLGWT